MDTLVGHSCQTLLWDTLEGHSCGTLALTHSDALWPHKLTVLRPQLPETASRTAFILQISALGPRFLLPILRPQLSEATFALPSGQF